MLLMFDAILINADVVNNVYIKNRTEETVERPAKFWHKPSTWFLPPIVTKTRMYTLVLDYRQGSVEKTFTNETDNYAVLKQQAKEIIRQVKAQVDMANREMVDHLFEEALKEAP